MRETRVANATDLELAVLPEYPEFNDDLRRAFLCAPTEQLVRDHIANMLVLHEATRFLSRDARRKRRGLIVGSALGVGALLGGAGAAAAAGKLPDGLQDVVATIAQPLGLDVPDGNSSDAPVGSSDDAPGRGAENPGQSEDAPGLQADPGNSENAPGHGGDNPGRSETAPGHSDSANNKPDQPPGLTEDRGNAPDVPPGQANVPPPHSKVGQAPATPSPGSEKGGTASGSRDKSD